MNEIQKVKVLGLRHLTDSAYVIRTERSNFEFIPGQCVNIGLVGSGVNREYSTYSGISDPYLEFLIKKIPGGAVSTGLSRLKPGMEVTLDGAYGNFTIKNPQAKCPFILVGTGTGIAPFHSFVKSYPAMDFKVLHGVRYTNEQYDKNDYPRGRYLACVSRGSGGHFSGRVTQYLAKHSYPSNSFYYLCGNRSMINDVYDILRATGVNGSNILTEVFF